MPNLSDLARRLTLLAGNGPDGVSERANAAAIFVATQIVVDLVQSTPVDESTALSNWQVGLGDRPAVPLPAYVPGHAGSSRAASIAETIAAATRILREKRPGESVWISNVLPYIRKLNDGSSSQAPAGFVERSELIGRKALQTAKF